MNDVTVNRILLLIVFGFFILVATDTTLLNVLVCILLAIFASLYIMISILELGVKAIVECINENKMPEEQT